MAYKNKGVNDEKLKYKLKESLKPIPPKSAVDSKMAASFGKKISNKRMSAS